MKYESKFSIDDVVWMVRDTRFSRIIKCSACKNTGKIKIAEEEYICPKCGGRAAHEAVMLPSPVDSFGRVIANGDSKSEGT